MQKYRNAARDLVYRCTQFRALFSYMQWTSERCLSQKWEKLSLTSTQMSKNSPKLSNFDCKSICVEEKTLKDTQTTTWVGKHLSISAPTSSNIVKEPTFRCNCDLHHLVASFIGSLEGLALRSKTQMKLLSLDVETTIKMKFHSILVELNQRHKRRDQANLDDCENESCPSTQFSQIQKSQFFDLQESL